ncbi:MAG: DUF177 domain-containing protein [Kiritimatiellae bacterium]|nr:DUF177 domain-containing protein [Kiritimatiellia bacterium]
METQGRLIVDVARLDEAGERLEGETAEGLLNLGDDPYITPVGGMHYRLRVERVIDELLVRGSVWQPIRCLCSRCAVPFETEAGEDEFVLSVPLDAKAGETDPLEATVPSVLFDGKTEYVDLTESVREAIILAFPSFPLCDEGCKGLCPVCGTNLNTETCACKRGGAAGGFAELGDLLKNDEPDESPANQRKRE